MVFIVIFFVSCLFEMKPSIPNILGVEEKLQFFCINSNRTQKNAQKLQLLDYIDKNTVFFNFIGFTVCDLTLTNEMDKAFELVVKDTKEVLDLVSFKAEVAISGS